MKKQAAKKPAKPVPSALGVRTAVKAGPGPGDLGGGGGNHNETLVADE
jgi:hypothetical protein